MTDNVDQLLDQAIADGLFDEMIVIVPDSDANSWWTGDWEKMVTEELIPLIDSEYRTIKDARYRMTAGCSMGGQGAFGVALTNPDLFSGAISFFGALSMAPTEEEDALHIAETESVEYLKYYTLYFICGNQDSYGFGEPAVELSQILSNRGVEHGFFIENGQHDSVFYVPYFTDAFAYLRANMYQSDETVETLLSGTAAIDTQNGTKVNVTFKALEGIEEYFNVIPASSYTENANPDLSIPLMIQVVQDGKVVHTQVERNHVVNSKNTTASYTYDFAKYVDASKDYTIVYKAAIFDRVVELARVSSKVSDENKDNTTIILPTQTPSTNTNTGTNVNTNTNTSTSAGTTTSASSAQTGDSTPVALYFVISVAALAGIGLSVFKKRKRA